MSNLPCYGRDFDAQLGVCKACSVRVVCEQDWRTGAYRDEHPDPWLDEAERAAFGRMTDYIEGRIADVPDIRPLDADYVAGYLMELCRQQHAKLHPPARKPATIGRCTCGKVIPYEAGCWDAGGVFVCVECYERQESAR